MKIAFADFLAWDYTVESVYKMALGGSQSALCYLAETLAKQGHEVLLLNHTSEPRISRSVICLPLNTAPVQLLKSLDALIVLNLPGRGLAIKPFLGDNTRLILWTQNDRDTVVTEKPLQNPAERDVYDGIALVSNWQRDRFHQHFGINLTRTEVLGNAIAPSFCGLFPDETPILAHKSKPPILAYTSTPFRGLDLLLDVFPRIRAAIPGTRLKVFSSMKVYQIADEEDESKYGWLYRQCQETPGVEYIGSLPQPELADELRSVTVLAYPNTFAETSCIAVMEAMASGCAIVTSDLGALPETTAGFARLIPIEGDWKAELETTGGTARLISNEHDLDAYKERFVQETVEVLRECTAKDTTEAEAHLRRQVNYVNRSYIWSVRAQQWVEWLNRIGAKPAVTLNSPTATAVDSQQLGYQCLIQGEYSQAISFYEQAIEAFPSVMSNYWYLGLTLLLQGEEAQAQATWMLAMLNGEPEQVDLWTRELVQVLQTEAERRKAIADYPTAELIQQHIADITTDRLT